MAETLKIGPEDSLIMQYEILHENTVLECNEAPEGDKYKMGEGYWPIQVELAMLDQSVPCKMTVNVLAKDNVFGEIDPERVLSMIHDDFDTTPALGELIEFDLPDGQSVEGQVLDVSDDAIKVDF